VKDKEAHEVVLHAHLVELGFADFAQRSRPGYLFLNAASGDDIRGAMAGRQLSLNHPKTLIVDSNDDPFGTTDPSAQNSGGVVFEIVRTGSSHNPTPAIVVNFNGMTDVRLGANLVGGLGDEWWPDHPLERSRQPRSDVERHGRRTSLEY
jgi:hypothetical protein